MARYVVVTFDDNAEAERFVASLAMDAVFLGVPDADGEMTFGPLAHASARAMYMKPTVFCDCSIGRVDGFKRGQKYGLWVHTKCGKPTKLWAQGDRWYAALGKNLLPIDAERPEWRGEGVYMHRFDQATGKWIHVENGTEWNSEAVLAELRQKGMADR